MVLAKNSETGSGFTSAKVRLVPAKQVYVAAQISFTTLSSLRLNGSFIEIDQYNWRLILALRIGASNISV